MRITRRNDEDVQTLARMIITARREALEAQTALKALEQRMMDQMFKAGKKTTELNEDGRKYRLTYVTRETIKVDNDGLRKDVSPEVWNKITKQTIDTKALEDALTDGLISPDVVGAHSVVGKSAPYLKVSESELTEGDE